jgi:Zn ribbon nucleic-acid-binding protein
MLHSVTIESEEARMSQPTCILCVHYHPHAEPHAPEPGWTSCRAGQHRLEHEIAGLRSAYLRLDEEVIAEIGAKDMISRQLPGAPTASPSTQPQVSGSRPRQLPINTDRVDILLPVIPGYVRDPHHDQVGHYSVAAVLNEWVAQWHDRWYANQRYPHTDAISLIDWIVPIRLREVMQHEAALTDFAEEIGELRARLRGALGEVRRKPATMWGVSCPRCQLISQLTLDPEDPDHYRECGNCGKLLTRDEYMQHLRDLVDQNRGRGLV